MDFSVPPVATSEQKSFVTPTAYSAAADVEKGVTPSRLREAMEEAVEEGKFFMDEERKDQSETGKFLEEPRLEYFGVKS